MKSFKTYLKEVALGTGSAGITSDVEPDFHRIDLDDVRARVNTWLEANCSMEFKTVEAALVQLSLKVQQIGLDFDVQTEVSGDSGSLNIPLSQFGGRFGKDTDTPPSEMLDDDGITHRTEGKELVLAVNYEKMPTGGYRVTGIIQ